LSKLSTPKPEQRQAVLEQRRQLKMAESAHAYVRGNTLQFYEWLQSRKPHTLPEGPAIWICGDCHLGNLGPVADSKGRVQIQIRDLDQTVIGNPAHDLVRLGLSLATAIRGSDLPGVTTARMLEMMIEGYESGLSSRSSRRKHAPHPGEPIRLILKEALRRKWRHLAEERIEDVKPHIPLGERFWALTEEEKETIKELFQADEARKLITCLHQRKNGSKVRVLDAAYWMKGCSSLGRLRYAALLKVGKGHKNGALCLIDVKEAVKAAAPHFAGTSMPADNAERVVQGARALSPYLGERMLPTRFMKRSVVVRELLPQDLKLEMEQLTCDEAVAAARFLAGVVGKAHARQMDAVTQRTWRAELKRNRPKNLDAPSWLWASVVELVATHEAAYLEHCRKYALAGVASSA
jgi:uncharacterized protein (DUF2252 family)